MSLEARLELRQREAKPIFIEVGQLIATMRKDVLPKSPLGKALGYHRHICAARTFRVVDRIVYQQLRKWARRTHRQDHH